MGLNTLDLVLIALYLVGITLFGLHFRKSQHSLRDYFLADRNVPWWAIALSIVAAETSTLTIISIPGLAYDTNLAFLQLVLGYLVARVIIVLIFIPQYFRGEMFTAYQLIDQRFGPRLRSLTAGLFLLTRAAAEGVRVFAVSIVVSIALGPMLANFSDMQRDVIAIGIVTLLTLVYTFEGGMTAVIWTDVVQMAIYVGGTIVGFVTILHLVPGGWTTIATVAGSAGKFSIFDFSFDVTRTYTFWAGLIGGTFLTTASHGTDQLMVQRLLAARNERQSKAALLASGVFILFQFTLFLLVGAMLFVFYKSVSPMAAFTRSDRIFPTFIVQQMPHGISGLLIAAILAAAMSNLSAALNSLSSTSMIDFYLRRRPQTSDARRILLSRVATIVWGLVLFALALLSRHGGRVVEVGLSIASVAYGALLGVFLLGILTKRASETGAMVGMACGFAVNVYAWLATLPPWFVVMSTRITGHAPAGTKLAWTWYVLLGTAVTFGVGYIASYFCTSNNRGPRTSRAPKDSQELRRVDG
ncbi:MAG TPA: sodium:solute symporter [Clostridia bacterium]|nr:sodium:solute symporter [Clostridia bacterium]